ncbi:Rhox homeobox family member 1 [Fukomys damarensis]|uniref:Rhox homeobox family member 1 n=2 Tax=Fukomys damarensis TaxID=885580 RepID=A0A091E2N7_FUKDA|nr:Rhox homeobox family member 1 [Fukomys damarensis]
MEAQPNYYDYPNFCIEYWMQSSPAWPTPDFPAVAPGCTFCEGALGLLGPNWSCEGYLDHAANYCPPQVVNFSQRGYANRREDQAHQEPQQLPPTQQNPSDARGRRGRRGPQVRFQAWQVEKLESVFRATQYPTVTTRRQLSGDLDVAESKVKACFNSRRAKYRKDQREMLMNVPPASQDPRPSEEVGELL